MNKFTVMFTFIGPFTVCKCIVDSLEEDTKTEFHCYTSLSVESNAFYSPHHASGMSPLVLFYTFHRRFFI